jgi:hypothetical protein
VFAAVVAAAVVVAVAFVVAADAVAADVLASDAVACARCFAKPPAAACDLCAGAAAFAVASAASIGFIAASLPS